MPQTRCSKKTPAMPPCPAVIDGQMDGQLPSDDAEDPKVNKWGCDFTDMEDIPGKKVCTFLTQSFLCDHIFHTGQKKWTTGTTFTIA
jgi:hypothetical protein